MHPGMMYWWKRAQRAAEEYAEHSGNHASCHSAQSEHRSSKHSKKHGYWAGGRGFGVRRPLRFMAHKLELDDDQVDVLARILNDLKTERAQAAVDDQRTISSIADSLAGADFDAATAKQALEQRVKTAERLRDEVLKALEGTHKLLTEEQRAKLAYLLRSGALTI